MLNWFLKLCLKLLLVLFILTVLQVALLRFIDPPFTAFMAWRWCESRITDVGYRWPDYRWKALREISSHLGRAVLAAEDQRFFSHRGFDFFELNEAVRDLLTAKRVRGASTITMQVARTVYLWHGRSWSRKLAEAYYTVLIETFWNKKRILEIYLNTVDWGPGVMGAEAASMKYFQKDASNLTASQSALLAAILPSPHKWSPNNPNKTVSERQKRIMKDMKKMPIL